MKISTVVVASVCFSGLFIHVSCKQGQNTEEANLTKVNYEVPKKTGSSKSAAKIKKEEEHDFHENYETARQNFLLLGQKIKELMPQTVIDSQLVDDPNAKNGESTIFIDSIFVPPLKDVGQNLIILTAGVHGVEAYTGHVLQKMYMDRYLNSQARKNQINFLKTGSLIIHTVNPFGFKYGRRFNSNNVDLNRNFFDIKSAEFPGKTIKNIYYDSFKHVLENEIGFLSILWQGLLHRKEISLALSGQYNSPKGIYYGGDKVQKEAEIVQNLFAVHAVNFRNVLHVDIHTGLGESGLNQIMPNPPPTNSEYLSSYKNELDALARYFPKDDCQRVCELQSAEDFAWQNTGDITAWLYAKYPEKRKNGTVIAVSSEIGTKSGLKVLPAVINENYCYWHRENCDAAELSRRTENMIEIFNPNDVNWQRKVLNGGDVLLRGFAKFSNL